MKNRRCKTVVAVVAVLLALSATAGAAEITIVNPGFEATVMAEGDYDYVVPPGWDTYGPLTDAGTWNPDADGAIFYGYLGVAPEGLNVAWIEPGEDTSGIAQVLADTLTAGLKYTLTVEVGNSYYYDWGEGYKVQLLAGGALLAEDDSTLTPTIDTFETSTVTYTSGPSVTPGQALEIRLLAKPGNGELDVDDVKLDTAPFTIYAGDDMVTWSGEPVTLDPTILIAGGILWTSDDPIAVFDPSATVKDPNVTIIKPASVTTAVWIENAGFEIPLKDDDLYSDNFDDCPGWSAIDNVFGGVWDISASNYGGNAPEGENIAYVYNATAGIEQVLAETVKADTTYTLTVEVGKNVAPIAAWTGYTVQLLAGGNLLGADDNSLTIEPDKFETSTVTYSSGADAVADPNVGQALTIRLLSLGGGEVNFDDVQLSTLGPAPNPYIVNLTLTVGSEEDVMKIEVYDNPCQAARIGKDLAKDNLGDFDGNCITDANDLDELAENWLTGGGLTVPVVKP